MTVTLGWLPDRLAVWCCCGPLCGATSYDNSSNNINNKCTINCHMLEASLCPGRAQIPMVIERYRSGRATRRRWTNRCAGVNLQLNRPERGGVVVKLR